MGRGVECELEWRLGKENVSRIGVGEGGGGGE